MENVNKKLFVKLLEETGRPGMDKLLGWLETTDFFTAPASTKYHGAHEGGLLVHSLNVYDRLMKLLEDQIEGLAGRKGAMPESMREQLNTVAVVALLHDLAKVNFYKKYFKNQKNKEGKWEQVEAWGYDDQFPQGHGEKSVMLIMQHGLALTDEEITAINWHMGGFDTRVKGGSRDLSAAWEKYPLAVLLHIADMQATWLDEIHGQKEGQA